MTPRYVIWALVACLSYSLVPPLVRVATREIPSTVAAFISNFVLLVITAAVIAALQEPIVPHLTTRSGALLVAAGVCLGVGILAYYHALELGPVSVVVPIFAMFIVGGSLIGFVFLGEMFTLRKMLGIGFGVLAIVLISS